MIINTIFRELYIYLRHENTPVGAEVFYSSGNTEH